MLFVVRDVFFVKEADKASHDVRQVKDKDVGGNEQSTYSKRGAQHSVKVVGVHQHDSNQEGYYQIREKKNFARDGL